MSVSRRSSISKRRNRRRYVAVFVPGLQGGVDESARYLFSGGPIGPFTPRIYQTKGLNSKTAPLRFCWVLLRVAGARLGGRLHLAHINVSAQGSTLRKIFVGFLLRRLRVKYVVQIHSGRYPRFWRDLGRLPRHFVKPLFGNAERTIVLGSNFRDFAIDELGVERSRVVLIPNAVPTPNEGCDQQVETPRVLFVGRLDSNKGYRDLLRALSTCDDLAWEATLLGDGENEDAKRLARKLGLERRVNVYDWASRSEISAALKSSNIFTLPSRCEAQALSLLEAMSHGLACIATPVGGHPDILTSELNGLFVTPGSDDDLRKALRRLLVDGDLRSELGAAARLDAQRYFSVPSVRQQYEALYGQLMGEGKETVTCSP